MYVKTPPKSDDLAQSNHLTESALKAKGDEPESGTKCGFDKFFRGAGPKGPSPKQKDSRQ
jgi:hypothetical protein